MMAWADIEQLIEAPAEGVATARAQALLAAGEAVLEHWLAAHDAVPTTATHEGFRLLALQRQGARDEPSFNACRETCRELAYHYNLIASRHDPAASAPALVMMTYVARHLLLFVGGKLAERGLGDFCCASRPLRQAGG